MTRDEIFEDVLKNWAECNSVCDVAVPRKREDYTLDRVDEYMEKLAGANYVKTQTLNYIFSNGLTTGSINQDKILEKFLYKTNERENLNLDEIRNAIGMAITHGHSGLRWLNGNVYQYKWGEYRALTYISQGIRKNVGYIVSKDGKKIPSLQFDYKNYREYQDFLRDLDDKNLILLSNREFQPIRNDTSLVYGKSPLLEDRERLDLMLATYERLNYDIRYDGPGRIVIRPKDGYVNGDGNDVSSSTVLNTSLGSEKKRVDKIKAEASRVAQEMKNSSSDSVIVLSNAFDENITHLERVTKATEFFSWLKNDTLILAQDFGMSPSLLELGNVSGNVSMTSIIDLAMLNSIVPLRERYATQFSSFLSEHLKLDKVYFNKYEMQQQEDENTMRTKIVNIMSLLNAMKDEGGNIRPNALQLFNDFASMLSENIHNENQKLERLSVAKRVDEARILLNSNKLE